MNNEKLPFLKGKGASVALVLCFVAVIAMVGAFTYNNYQGRMEQQLAQAEEQTEELTKEDSEETTGNDIVLPESKRNTSDAEEEADESEEDEKDAEKEASEDENTDNVSTAGQTADVWFSEESVLEWPASGAVLINYSMDQTVYFSTLEQYKYNPALIIGGEVGENIGASAPGIVTNVEQDAQTGLTVTLDMGNGYSRVFGQLKEVPVQIGDYVEKGQIVGYLSEPTKYFSMEGPNLYFEILKDEVPVNPLDFMEG